VVIKLDDEITEKRLEKIRVFLSSFFDKEYTKEEALDLVVENFYSRFLEAIEKNQK
jgi:hypothetical protein